MKFLPEVVLSEAWKYLDLYKSPGGGVGSGES